MNATGMVAFILGFGSTFILKIIEKGLSVKKKMPDSIFNRTV